MEFKLVDTVGLMLSEDYVDRFKAEYWQTMIRYEELNEVLTISDSKEMEKLNTHKMILEEKRTHMKDYLIDMETIARLKGIDLRKVL